MCPTPDIKALSRSPQQWSRRAERYLARRTEGVLAQSPDTQAMVDYIQSAEERRLERELQPEFWVNNLEADLRSTDWILEKARFRQDYAQNLYAALCNNEFQRNEVMPILKNEQWSCSWRYAGGIVADMRQQGDYMDWYCSGIRDTEPPTEEEWAEMSQDKQDSWSAIYSHYVSESVVTDEIKQDLARLGWRVVDQQDLMI